MIIYKCKTCSAKLADNATVCLQCGDTDAIYNLECERLNKKKIKNSNKLFILIEVVFGIFGWVLFIVIVAKGFKGQWRQVLFLIVLFYAIRLLGKWIYDKLDYEWEKRYQNAVSNKENLRITTMNKKEDEN